MSAGHGRTAAGATRAGRAILAGVVALVAVVASTGFAAPASPAAEPGRPGAVGETVGLALLVVAAVGVVALVRWLTTWGAADPTAVPGEPARPKVPEEPARPVQPAGPGASSVTAPGTDPRAPGGLRPGQLATCRDGRADPVAVTATLVDLAARGFLRIRAVPGVRGRLDWLLIAVPRPAGDRLLPYEETLLDAVFADQSSALLGSLDRRRLSVVRRELVTDAVAHGRLRDPRDDGYLLRRALRALDAAAPLPRTPAGDALVEEFVALPGEAGGGVPPTASDDDACAFDRWLPHAIVLGTAEDWADRFRTSVGDGRGLRWYAVSRRVGGTGRDAADDACDGVLTFTTAMNDGVTGPSWSGGSGHSSGFGDPGGYGDTSGFGGFGGSSSSDWSGGGGGGGCGGSSGGGS